LTVEYQGILHRRVEVQNLPKAQNLFTGGSFILYSLLTDSFTDASRRQRKKLQIKDITECTK
jgi:hypothetical protein